MKEKEIKEQDNLSGRENKKTLSILKNKGIWISGIIGLVLGSIIIFLLGFFNILTFGNETIATLKEDKITEINIYEEMDNNSKIENILQVVDKTILTNKYILSETQEKEITEEIDSLFAEYKNYFAAMYDNEEELEKTFLEYYGFGTMEELKNYMKDSYRTELFYIDCFKPLIPAEDIENYYNENIEFGEVNTKHMLVQTSDKITDKEALELAKEIIAKLNEGKSFEDVAEQYADKIISEDVNFNNYDAAYLAKEYVDASKKLTKDTYTKEPVKTSFGYHVIYCVNITKPTLEEATNDIVKMLATDLQLQDEYIAEKAMIKLREEYNFKFKDEKLQEIYDKYCEQLNATIEE